MSLERLYSLSGKEIKDRLKSEMVAEAYTILMEAYIKQIGRVISGLKY